jgi:hypothetical protein
MSSWTDSDLELSPYQQQLPLEAMVKTGMLREEQFQEGIKTVQGIYDSFLSLPIAKSEVKDYVKDKVGQLNKAVGQSISGDFSDRRLINQIAGLSSQISSDPIVQNGVQSTARIQSGYAKQKADQELNAKNGKNPTNNINDYNDNVNAWMADGKLDTTFQGDYSPYVDVIDRAIKLFKEQTPGDNISRDAFFIDKDGKTQVNPVLKEGVDPNRIQSVLNLVYQQGDVQQQLAIDGRQNYKGVTPEMLSHTMVESTNHTLKNIEDTIKGLQLKMATDGTINAVATTNQINQLKELAKQTKDDFSNSSSLLLSNPDALKARLVQQGITSNFLNAYSYEKMKKSPLWETTMESMKYELDLVKNGMEQEKFKFDMLEKNRRYNLDVSKEQRLAAGKGLDEDGNPISNGPSATSTTGNVPESSGKMGSSTFNTLFENAKEDLNQGNFGIVFDIYNSKETEAGDFNPIKRDPATGALVYNIDPTGVSGYKSMMEASIKYLNTFTEAAGTLGLGTARPEVKTAFQKVQPQTQYVQALTVRKAELDAKKDAVLAQIKAKTGNSNPDFVDAYIVQNKLTDWSSSQARLKQKYGDSWEKGLGLIGDEKTSAKGDFQGYATGKQEKAYKEFKSKFDATITPQFQEVEKAYKESQLNLLPIHTAISAAKAEDKEKMRIAYDNIASAYSAGNKAYGSFRDLLESDSKGGFKDNIYGGVYDPLEKKYYLTVTRGGEQGNKIEKVEVTKQEFENASPALKSDNAFWNKFGDLLSITNKTTTDVKQNGRSGGYATSYKMDRPADSKYQVGYHVVSAGKDVYNLQLYIKDKQGNDILKTTANVAATPAGIMDAINQLQNNDVYIDALINQGK